MNREEQRRWLAEQAARCMHESAIDDPMRALQRVVRRQGMAGDRRNWPDAAQIRAALRDYQRLFRDPGQNVQLETRWRAAYEAMRFFASFRPYLVSPMLEGVAGTQSPVQLHLHADDVEALPAFLREHGIPHRVGERRLHLLPNRPQAVPVVTLEADGIGFELWLLPTTSERQAPLESDGRTPMQRVGLSRMMQRGLDGHAVPGTQAQG